MLDSTNKKKIVAESRIKSSNGLDRYGATAQPIQDKTKLGSFIDTFLRKK